MRRGVNVGNALDGRRHEVRPVGADTVALIQQAGFDTVRIPVRWSAHAARVPPFTIAPSCFDLVDTAIAAAVEADLDIVVNVHHYEDLNANPTHEHPRFLALWSQIAARYANYSGRLHFELLNEPRAELTPGRWNRLLRQALAVVRQTNPQRRVLIGPAAMNTLDALGELQLPADRDLILTVHYYSPMSFTHQGAPWQPDAERWIGTTWDPVGDGAAVRADLAALAAWADHRGVPAFVGEFGTYEVADMAARAAWTATVRRELERLGIGWCYWDLDTDFGVYDAARGSWREPLRTALLAP